MDQAAELGQRYHGQGELQRAETLLKFAEKMKYVCPRGQHAQGVAYIVACRADVAQVTAMQAQRRSVPVLAYRDYTFPFKQ